MVYYPPEKKFDIKEIINREDKSSSLELVQRKKKKKMLIKKALFVFTLFIFLAVASVGYIAYKANSTFDKMTGQQNSVLENIIRMLPMGDNFFQILPVENGDVSMMEKLKNNELERLNILLLGIRGVDDPNGGLLTDTIMVISAKPKTGEVALISIPRDLYVKMPYTNHKNKINEAYALGIKNGDWKDGLSYSKKVIADVTGLNIHYAASVDFKAFKEMIDVLGGVTITLDKPFVENTPFAEGVISLPAGKQVIDGDEALLFVRARFSSSDFDRAKRQQQILLAVKEKAFSLGVLSNPIKIMSILGSVGNHVRTDAELWEIQEIVVMGKKIESSNVKRKVFNTATDGLLYSSWDYNGSYILLPEGGNFNKIKKACADIF